MKVRGQVKKGLPTTDGFIVYFQDIEWEVEGDPFGVHEILPFHAELEAGGTISFEIETPNSGQEL